MAQRIPRPIPTSAPAAATPQPAREAGAATTRERILDVALDLFVRKGYAETALREIATAVGVSKAALYYHFESKQDILLALHMRLHQSTEDVLPLLQARAMDSWEQFVDQLLDVALQHRRLIELSLRNQEAIAALHQGPALAKHGEIQKQHELQDYVTAMLQDPTLPVEVRVRRMASLGAIAGSLLPAHAVADVPDADLRAILRGVIHDVLAGPGRQSD
jgi:AcrR family transcriptional regulator